MSYTSNIIFSSRNERELTERFFWENCVSEKSYFQKNYTSEKATILKNHNSEKITFLRELLFWEINLFNYSQSKTKTALANFQLHASISGPSYPSVPN